MSSETKQDIGGTEGRSLVLELSAGEWRMDKANGRRDRTAKRETRGGEECCLETWTTSREEAKEGR
jgi:hypothetical protein